MFLERLNEAANRIRDSIALSLVAVDGIPVETVRTDDGELDLEALTAELMIQIQTIGENHKDLSSGEVRTYSVTTAELTLVVSSVTENYYLLLVLGPEGSYGQARFELRRARLLLEHDLM